MIITLADITFFLCFNNPAQSFIEIKSIYLKTDFLIISYVQNVSTFEIHV